MPASRARLIQELTSVVGAAGADLEDVAITRAGRRSVVRIVVDADGGVTLDDLARVSSALSEALDELDAREPTLLGGTYVLEVSSPGVERPLTLPRHWRRNTTRLVTAHLHEGEPLTGRLVSADDAEDGGFVLDVAGVEHPLAYGDVVRGQVQLEFSRPATTDEEDPA